MRADVPVHGFQLNLPNQNVEGQGMLPKAGLLKCKCSHDREMYANWVAS